MFKNPRSQSQDQMIDFLPSFRLEDSAGHHLSSLLTYSLLCGKNGNHLGDGGHSQNVPLSNLDITSGSQEPAFIQAVPGNTPQFGCVVCMYVWMDVWMPFLKQESKSFKGADLWHLKLGSGASLVAQWLRICLPMQGTRVRALVWEDPTCHGATRPVSHNC